MGFDASDPAIRQTELQNAELIRDAQIILATIEAVGFGDIELIFGSTPIAGWVPLVVGQFSYGANSETLTGGDLFMAAQAARRQNERAGLLSQVRGKARPRTSYYDTAARMVLDRLGVKYGVEAWAKLAREHGYADGVVTED